MFGKLQRTHHTWRGHFAPNYLGGSSKFTVYLFFIYDWYQLLTTEYVSLVVLIHIMCLIQCRYIASTWCIYVQYLSECLIIYKVDRERKGGWGKDINIDI